MLNKHSNRRHAGASIERLTKQLTEIDPDVSYGDWVRVLMVIFNETQGSEEGFELANDWSSQGQKYRGEMDVMKSWKYFKLDHERPVGIASLVRMAHGSR